jgi:hypothetical protein
LTSPTGLQLALLRSCLSPERQRARQLTALALASLTLAIGATGCGGPPRPPVPARIPVSGLGINGWYLFWQMPPSVWNANVAAIAAAGIKVVRVDAFWATAEPAAPVAGKAKFNWLPTDGIVATLAAHGLQWLPVIDYATAWDQSIPGQVTSVPVDPAPYAAYAAALVGRYGPDGSFWREHPSIPTQPVHAVEIWNEPNVPGTAIPAATYATMYADARTAIHSVDPSAEVIIGGLGNPSADYLRSVLRALPDPHAVDAVGAHPYGFTPDDVLASVASLRAALDSAGDASVPIDVTEFGWPTNGSASWIATVSDATRAGYLSQVVDALATADCGVERIIPYAWVTGQQGTGNPEQWFGLSNAGAATASTKALGSAYTSIAASGKAPPAGFAVCPRPRAGGG